MLAEGVAEDEPVALLWPEALGVTEELPQFVPLGVLDLVALAESEGVAAPVDVSVVETEGVPDIDRVMVSVAEGEVLGHPDTVKVTLIVGLPLREADKVGVAVSHRDTEAQLVMLGEEVPD